jgi:RNA polymerase sigma factor (sigma-70 family)
MADARDPLDASALLSCHDAVMRLAARLTLDPNVADDIAQQAMLQMLRAPPRAGPGLRSFLAKVVANVATNFRLADSRRVARERAAASPEPLPPTADLVAQLSAHKDVVDELLRLEEPARTIVFLRFFRDEKPRAIAERLGEPVATIETRLRRALARLRERLDQRHGERSRGAPPICAPRPTRTARSRCHPHGSRAGRCGSCARATARRWRATSSCPSTASR